MGERFVRVRSAAEGGSCAVRHPVHGELVVPNPAEQYSADDPLVREYPWLFRSEAQAAQARTAPAVTEVPIEDATARPGGRRSTRR